MEETEMTTERLTKMMELKLNLGNDDLASKDRNNNKSVEEIFSCIWDLEEAHEVLTPSMITDEKSEVLASVLRLQGNEQFKNKDLEKALELYNLSIMAAPHPVLKDAVGKTKAEEDCFVPPHIHPSRYGGFDGHRSALALGYANRSAIMFELGFYDKCLNDINLAMGYGYPEDKHAKLEDRKQKCLTAQSEDITTESSPALTPQLQILEGDRSLKTLLSYSIHKPPKLVNVNPAFPSLSSAIKVAQVPGKGRGWVAVRDIRPGEILCVERAYSISVDVKKLATYCSYCLNFCLTPLPCPGCSKVIFCNETCRSRALAEDHWIDCIILPTMAALEMPLLNIPYKLLKTFSYQKLTNIHKKLQKEKFDLPENMGRNKKGIYDSASYQAVHHLITNEKKFDTNQLIKQTPYVFIINKLLQLSGRYFVDDSGNPVTPTREDMVATGALLLAHSCRLQFNQNKITNTEFAERVASGLFPAASLANHACNRNSFHYFSGRKIVIRALQPIRCGEEVTVSYLQGFSKLDLNKRTQDLAGFHIRCSCEACKHNWPTHSRSPEINYKCIICQKPTVITYEKVDPDPENPFCANCLQTTEQKVLQGKKQKWKGPTDLAVAFKDFKRIQRKLTTNEVISKKDLKDLVSKSEILHRHLISPCQSINLINSMVINCFEVGMYER